MLRLLSQVQAQTNGYFGGYISKRQKCGKLETRKCVDKMYVLRAKQAGKSDLEQQRAVTGRMVTDIDMNGTLRGVVEQFNLCANLRHNDVLFAECIRSFPSVFLDGQQWLHRLAVETEHISKKCVPNPMCTNLRSERVHPECTYAYMYTYIYIYVLTCCSVA